MKGTLKTLLKNAGSVVALVLFFVAVDYFLKHFGLTSLNHRFIFGLIGTNLIASMTAVIALTTLWLWLEKRKNLHFLLILISSATIANLFERFFFGGVIDYFNLFFIPAFNMSDIIIVVSMVSLMIILFLDKTSVR